MSTPRVTEEKVARWVSTAVFIGCAGGLMWALGSTLGVWAGLGAGAVVSAVVGGRLWVRHLDNASIERDRQANAALGTGRGYVAQPDVDAPTTTQRGQPGGYYDDDDD